jgi:transposase
MIGYIIPKEKPLNMMNLHAITSRKALNGILYFLGTRCQWKMLPKEYSYGSTGHRRFQQRDKMDIFKKIWARLLEEYDSKRGIKWTWQSLDSISIKSPLGGHDRK